MAQPNARLERLAWIIQHQTAELVTLALTHINQELNAADGYPAGGKGGEIRGTSELTSVERAANARYELGSTREQIRDDLDALITMHGDFDRMLRRTLGTRLPRHIPELCDATGKRYEGYLLVWTPRSRDDNNGWHNPACRDIAGATGLCDACRLRMNGWRSRHGLPLVAVHDATEVAA